MRVGRRLEVESESGPRRPAGRPLAGSERGKRSRFRRGPSAQSRRSLGGWRSAASRCSTAARQPLPQKREVIAIVRGLQEVIYPGYFGDQSLYREYLHGHLGDQLFALSQPSRGRGAQGAGRTLPQAPGARRCRRRPSRPREVVTAFFERLPGGHGADRRPTSRPPTRAIPRRPASRRSSSRTRASRRSSRTASRTSCTRSGCR